MKPSPSFFAFVLTFLAFASSPPAPGQNFSNLQEFVETPAVSGYEQNLATKIRHRLKNFSPQTDNLGNVYVTLGSGAPHRLLVTPMDEPGYIVSAITPDGFLRVQRLPQQVPHPLFDLLHSAQPISVMTRAGKVVPGVVAGLSVHLQPGRHNALKVASPDDMYIDIGATSEAEARKAGVDLLDPIALARKFYSVGYTSFTAPAIGDRFGCGILVDLLLGMDSLKVQGTLTVAFVAQQWSGGRGLERLLNEIQPDEMLFVGRLLVPAAGAASAGQASAPESVQQPPPGSGVLLATQDGASAPSAFASELKKLGEATHIAIATQSALPPRSGPVGQPTHFPQRFAQLSVPSLWPVTPGEVVGRSDIEQLQALLAKYTGASLSQRGGVPGGSVSGISHHYLRSLVETYGPSGHEKNVREKVVGLLPTWIRTKAETDPAGNLVLHWGASGKEKAPRIAFVAHMDEIGYQVRSITDDGRLVVEVLGGGLTEYFLGHVVLVHTGSGATAVGVLELPNGWDKPGYEWPHNSRSMNEPVRVYVGARSRAEVEKLGIKVGDGITIPKEYRTLIARRATARSFDDRVGCVALIDAVNAMGPNGPGTGRDVTFIWSTEEELGLRGAAAAAERVANEGHTPDFVFAIDTFVSSDSPLESKRFANAEIGKGFVIRAVDNSSITPREYVDRVVALARANHIPVQYGTTGGGNDGSTFLRYGSVDIPIGWPLRYSHSPGEVIDTGDVDALTRIITLLAKNW